MKMSEFVAELQRIIDEEYSNLKIDVYINAGISDSDCSESKIPIDTAISIIHLGSSFAIHLEEWKNNDSIGREILIYTRILHMLFQLQDKVKQDIERIEKCRNQR